VQPLDFDIRAQQRGALVRTMAAEPAFRERWLRSLAGELRGLPPAPSRTRS